MRIVLIRAVTKTINSIANFPESAGSSKNMRDIVKNYAGVVEWYTRKI